MPEDPILLVDDPRLRIRCREVGDDPHRDEISRVKVALAAARSRHGFGRALAAAQIGIPRRIIAVDLGAGPFALVDPEITWRSAEEVVLWDDCFSIPDRIVRVRRHRSISLRYRDEQRRVREWQELPTDLAELVQHEIDHLDGILMIDRADGPDAVQPIARHAALIGAMRPSHRLALDQIAAAASAIDPVFRSTPLLDCEPLSELAGCSLALKVETINPIRSFKGRGADWFMAGVREARPLACASAGNFGQAMAYACRRRGIPLTVFAARGASPLKIERMRALGARVVEDGDDFEAAKVSARSWAAQHDARFVEDGREAAISEGAGSIAVELVASGHAFDAVVVPLGDGALISGIGRWLEAASPATRVIGVVSRGAPAFRDSWLRGERVVHDEVHTIADGIAVRAPVDLALADVCGVVDDIVTVDDDGLIEAMRLVHAHGGLVAEPSGVAGIAAILADPARFAGRRVATVLTGSNVSREQMRAWAL